jgi:DNA-binding LacI/PurR family transcriptional regulator
VGSAALRLEGYRAALAKADVQFDPDLVVHREGWHRTDGAAAMRELQLRGTQFDAVFALNDELALGALRTLFHDGVRIPEDVAVVGFDNVTEAQFAMPSLTTIDPNRVQIAETAVEALVERIGERDFKERSAPRVFTVPATLVTRESAPAGTRIAVA